MRRSAAVVACALLGACAAIASQFMPSYPGRGITPEFAQRWGCDYALVVARADSAKANLRPSEQFTPRVGWDACTLMTANGIPADVSYVESASGREAHWLWRGDAKAYLVVLVRREGTWTVDYVGW